MQVATDIFKTKGPGRPIEEYGSKQAASRFQRGAGVQMKHAMGSTRLIRLAQHSSAGILPNDFTQWPARGRVASTSSCPRRDQSGAVPSPSMMLFSLLTKQISDVFKGQKGMDDKGFRHQMTPGEHSEWACGGFATNFSHLERSSQWSNIWCVRLWGSLNYRHEQVLDR